MFYRKSHPVKIGSGTLPQETQNGNNTCRVFQQQEPFCKSVHEPGNGWGIHAPWNGERGGNVHPPVGSYRFCGKHPCIRQKQITKAIICLSFRILLLLLPVTDTIVKSCPDIAVVYGHLIYLQIDLMHQIAHTILPSRSVSFIFSR